MTQKVFVTKNGKANVSCPGCGKVKPMDVSRFKTMDQKVKLKCTCSCKTIFPIELERRQHIRKPVSLNGELLFGDKLAPIIVVDVSRLGLKLKTRNPFKLVKDDKITVKFTLDDVGKSRVSKEAEIKSVTADSLGVAFTSTDHYDKFGHYILFHSQQRP